MRVSGPDVRRIGACVIGDLPAPRHACLRTFRNSGGESIDRGLALFMPCPASYTGEDILELQGHGGPVVTAMVLDCVLHAGARVARPGEFSERAFLNERLDLSQAEAVVDLIESASEQAARSAMRSLEGAFSERVRGLVDDLVGIRAHVEAAIDFPEEEIDYLAGSGVALRLDTLRRAFADTIDQAHQGRMLRDGLSVVIAGAPNVGKSTLLNRLTGRDAAIVTDVPGTTRDILREALHLDGLPIQLVDTAGLRLSTDRVEQLGVDRARAAIAGADAVLHLIDDRASSTPTESAPCTSSTQTLLRVRNKIDLTGSPPGLDDGSTPPVLRISAKTGAGLPELRNCLQGIAGYRPGGNGTFIARRRHLEALEEAAAAVERGTEQFVGLGAGELLAEELGEAQRALGRISGIVSTEDLLEQIFSSFCIGK